jgi:glutaminyl-peptide cyclotransferase
MKKALGFTCLVLISTLISCNNGETDDPPPAENNVKQINYTVVDTLPHDTAAFTQGLEFYKGSLIEGTGNYGFSRLFRKELATGKILKEVKLDSALFGEGITILRDTIYQLTWREHIVNVYSAADFRKIRQSSISTEGWGITHDSTRLIVTDGSNNLYFYEPSTFKLLNTVQVTENGSPAVNLNELEYIRGFIYSNQWQYNYILKIDPATGEVVGKLDLTDLANRARAKNPNEQFLNGIAYDPSTDKIYVTGKYWPEMFQISFPH